MTVDLSMFYTTDDEGNKVELPRPETKSWPDVVQCVNHWQGNPAGEWVIDVFIELYLQGIQWDWYELNYKPWLLACEKVKEWNDAREPDEDGNLPDPMPEPPEPVKPDMETVAEVRLRKNVHTIYQDNATARHDRQVHDQLVKEKQEQTVINNFVRGLM